MKEIEGSQKMQITKGEYIEMVRRSLDELTEDVAGKLFTLGSFQSFTKDNDIFEAIHAYLGSLEVPVSTDEYQEIVDAIRGLLENYNNEKRGDAKATS